MIEEFKIKFDNGREFLLPDISYENFVELLFDCGKIVMENGASDFEYDKYLRSKNMVELTDFNSQSTADGMTLIHINNSRERILKFKCVYDSDNDEDFEWEKYKEFVNGNNG